MLKPTPSMKIKKMMSVTDITKQNTLKFAYGVKSKLDIWMIILTVLEDYRRK